MNTQEGCGGGHCSQSLVGPLLHGDCQSSGAQTQAGRGLQALRGAGMPAHDSINQQGGLVLHCSVLYKSVIRKLNTMKQHRSDHCCSDFARQTGALLQASALLFCTFQMLRVSKGKLTPGPQVVPGISTTTAADSYKTPEAGLLQIWGLGSKVSPCQWLA